MTCHSSDGKLLPGTSVSSFPTMRAYVGLLFHGQGARHSPGLELPQARKCQKHPHSAAQCREASTLPGCMEGSGLGAGQPALLKGRDGCRPHCSIPAPRPGLELAPTSTAPGRLLCSLLSPPKSPNTALLPHPTSQVLMLLWSPKGLFLGGVSLPPYAAIIHLTQLIGAGTSTPLPGLSLQPASQPPPNQGLQEAELACPHLDP